MKALEPTASRERSASLSIMVVIVFVFVLLWNPFRFYDRAASEIVGYFLGCQLYDNLSASRA